MSIVQIDWSVLHTPDQYVAEAAWLGAKLDECPFHPEDGCGLRGHGSYGRAAPAGVRIARLFCPKAGVTISLLPRFLAARLPGTLDEVEAVVDEVERAASVPAAAEALRPADDPDAVTSTTAMRWVRRRLRAVRAALVAAVTLLPDLAGCAPTLEAVRQALGVARVLVDLRQRAAVHLRSLRPPLGFLARAGR